MTASEALNELLPIGSCILEELKRVEQDHSCILAAFVATQVFNSLGYRSAHPLTVRVRILNPPLLKWCRDTKRLPDASTEPEWSRLGGQPVFLGAEPVSGEDWVGHVVVIVPSLTRGQSAMFDLTIPQVTKAGAGLDIPPLFLPVSDEFVRGGPAHEQEVNGSLVVYGAFPNDLGYKTSEIWAIRSKTTWFIDNIVAKIHKGS